MNFLKIALLQIAPCETLKKNLEKGIFYCEKAKANGADIALFPEMWSNGYNIYNRPIDEWQAEAIAVNSDFVNTFRIVCFDKKVFVKSTRSEMILLFASAQKEVNSKLLLVFLPLFVFFSCSLIWAERVVLE